MRTRVKICGITRAEDARIAVDAGADALGFVFAPESPRRVTPETAAMLVDGLPPFVARVALFVDARPDAVRSVLERARLDTVQFHGDESPEVCRAFRDRFRVIKALRVRGPETLEAVAAYRGSVDAILLDAWVPGVAGGTGARFDWNLAVAAGQSGLPVVLAGGLNPGNVAGAIEQVRPFAVDVSSGVEASPGHKDPARLRAFLEAVSAMRPATS
ncbi:MAG: phosphoribosylanthranilate isomerase [Verrucomicrobia bacterium]|nr:phosphoribosylanthranilate isomerase [Verrucomicrobiota bacterium]